MPGISLGLQSPYGYGSNDLTSPAQAARVGALVDQQWEDEPALPLELRIHGVSGSTGPTILEHPNVVQVGGSGATAFYRRWSPDGVGRPSVPWPLEAYVWGGLTRRALVSACWLLLLPFMLYNVVYYMLPAGAAKSRGRRLRSVHGLARVVVRLLALAATAQFVGSLVTLFHSTIAWQNGITRLSASWWWLSWYTEASTATRMSVATVAVAAVVCALWYAGAATAGHYEAFSTDRSDSYEPGQQVDGDLPSGRLTLRDRGFWRGASSAARLRNTHIAVAFATISLALAGCTPTFGRWQQAQLAVSAAILVAAVVLAGFVADRDTVGGNDDVARFATWFKALAWISGLVLLAGTVASPWVVDNAPVDPRHAPHGLLGAVTTLTVIQFGLVVALAGLVAVLLRRSDSTTPPDGWKPFLRGYAAPVLALLAVLLGGVLTAALNLSAARLFGEPGGLSLHKQHADPANTILLPDSMFAYSAAAAFNLIPILLIGGLLYLRYRTMTKRFAARTAGPGGLDGGPDPVVDWYPPHERDAPEAAVRKVAKDWALASLTDHVAEVIGGVTICWAVFFWVFEGLAISHTSQPFLGVAGVVPTIGVFIGALLAASGVWLLRAQIRSPNARKTIGIIWDVGTFWPRAVHPLAPPCYAEQAVPEVVDRIWVLTGARADGGHATPVPGETSAAIEVIPRHVLLTGYSQGTAISVAVIAQLPEDVLDRVSLLTLAAPLRRLYGRAFPAYFGYQAALALRELLSGPENPALPPDLRAPEPPRPRWRNVMRRSDYIGGWVFGLPVPRERPAHCRQVDVLSLDPPSLEPDHGTVLAPTHFHSAFWPDPVVILHARELADR